MPPLLLSLIFRKMPEAPMPFFVRPVVRGIADKVQKSFVGAAAGAASRLHGAGPGRCRLVRGDDFTAADIQMSFPARGRRRRRVARRTRPRLQAFVARARRAPRLPARAQEGRTLRAGVLK
jgi:glutathione S-transferase